MGELPATFRAIGSRNGLRRVLVAYALYGLVEIAVWLAIILYAFAEGGVTLAGLVAVVQLLPAAVLAPALASIGDRMPRGTALALAHAGVAVATIITTVALLLDAPVPLVITGSTLITVALAVVRPIHFAALPQLAQSAEDLVSANALSSVGDGFALFAGPIVAGFGVQQAGPALVFVGASAASVVATLLCTRLGLRAPTPSPDGESRGWREVFYGLAALWRDWAALVLLFVLATRFILAGALDVLGVSFSEDVLDLGQSGAGLILGAVGVGGLLGSVIVGSVATRRRLAPVVLVSGVVEGLAVAVVALLTLLTPTIIALAVAGMAGAILLVIGRTLLQRTADDRVLARVFAVQESTALLGLALGAALAPYLVENLSPAAAFVPFGIGAAALTLVGFIAVRRLDARANFLPEETELLRNIGFLAALPPYEIERLAMNGVWTDATAGEIIVKQGDLGDRFYAIGAGEFSIIIDGSPRPGLLGRGEGFGELALLRSAPRNATITAVSDGRLLAIASDVFLAAVTGGADGHALADEVSRAHVERDRRHGG
jgi:MFS family permease